MPIDVALSCRESNYQQFVRILSLAWACVGPPIGMKWQGSE
jgi:hypothetical protein